VSKIPLFARLLHSGWARLCCTCTPYTLDLHLRTRRASQMRASHSARASKASGASMQPAIEVESPRRVCLIQFHPIRFASLYSYFHPLSSSIHPSIHPCRLRPGATRRNLNAAKRNTNFNINLNINGTGHRSPWRERKQVRQTPVLLQCT
jgi:hypothetical protein